MCGIVGLVGPGGHQEKEEKVRRGAEALRHRGPDAIGVWADAKASLGHTRLSIIDLSEAANQPLQLSGVPVVISFNGEIFNYRELRAELAAMGYQFRTRSDTEVILAAYVAWDTAAFAKLAGMFAFAIWDGRSNRLVLARDRFGIKPLYFCRLEETFYFASEPKAILAMADKFERRLDHQAMHEFLWFGNALGEHTLFKGIKRLAPGTFMTLEATREQVKSFWSMTQLRAVRDSYQVAVTEVRERIRQAVRSHLVADVPVGVFLSGGVDSSTITAFAAEEYGATLQTFSVAFDFQKNSELPYARLVARRFGTRHEELMITAPDARDLIATLIRCHDEPFSDAANIPLYLLARHLKNRVKVVLQGDGGDELFAGYQRYEWLRWACLPWWVVRNALRSLWSPHKRLPFWLGRIGRIIEALGAPEEKRCALLLTVETERCPPARVLGREFREIISSHDPFLRYRQVLAEVGDEDPVQSMLRTDMRIILPDTFLEKVDKSTMAHGVEARVPLLDNDLAEYVLQLPADFKVRIGEKKRILRGALRGIVPDEVLDRPKTGFGVPYQDWLRGPLYDFLLTSVSGSRATRDGILDFAVVESLAREHANGSRDNGFLMWKTLNFALWYEEYRVLA